MKTFRCDSCSASMINGVFCHEKGCPNIGKVYSNGEWVRTYRCRICGYTRLDGELCCEGEEI
jgi:hypothetical protein